MTGVATHLPPAVRFSPAVVLTKHEAFDACEACAEAERALLRAGREGEAGRIADLFALLEGRMMVGPPPTGLPQSVLSGSNSSDSELTQ